MTIEGQMYAIRLHAPGDPERLAYERIATPQPWPRRGARPRPRGRDHPRRARLARGSPPRHAVI
jgi:hypothetical protein